MLYFFKSNILALMKFCFSLPLVDHLSISNFPSGGSLPRIWYQVWLEMQKQKMVNLRPT